MKLATQLQGFTAMTAPLRTDIERHGLLRQESSDVSDVATPLRHHSPIPEHHEDLAYDAVSPIEATRRDSYGLGILGTSYPVSIRRVPVGARRSSATLLNKAPEESFGSTSSENTPNVPGSGRPLLTPTFSRPDHAGNKDYRYDGIDHGNPSDPFDSRQNTPQRYASYENTPNTATTLTPGMEHSQPQFVECTARRDIYSSSGSRLSVIIFILSIYSTVMSGVWFVAAIIQPRWGRAIHTNGALSPSTASLLSALFAKTIELSFVTVFVGFLGQVLSRRSIVQRSRGITLAEMSMRTWIIQPGALLTHAAPLRYAGLTFLGVISLTASIAAMLYTTASDALVSPKLMFGGWDMVQMQGLVTQTYANSIKIKADCETPIMLDQDEHSGETCISIEHAGSGEYV